MIQHQAICQKKMKSKTVCECIEIQIGTWRLDLSARDKTNKNEIETSKHFPEHLANSRNVV